MILFRPLNNRHHHSAHPHGELVIRCEQLGEDRPANDHEYLRVNRRPVPLTFFLRSWKEPLPPPSSPSGSTPIVCSKPAPRTRQYRCRPQQYRAMSNDRQAIQHGASEHASCKSRRSACDSSLRAGGNACVLPVPPWGLSQYFVSGTAWTAHVDDVITRP